MNRRPPPAIASPRPAHPVPVGVPPSGGSSSRASARRPSSPIPLFASLVALLWLAAPPAARAYIDIAYSLGRVIKESSNILSVRVASVDRQANRIVFQKVRDIKGQHRGDLIKHEIGQLGLDPRERQTIMAWAEVGKTAVFFHNGANSEMCLDNYWYQAPASGEWWRLFHSEPIFLMAYCGSPEKLIPLLDAMMAGQEVIVPCMVGGPASHGTVTPDFLALFNRTSRMMRMRASLQLADYNQKRDFVGWGAEEFRRLEGMPGFGYFSGVSRTGPGAGGVAPADFNGDEKPDFCLYGENRCLLLRNDGGSFNEVVLGLRTGARAAAWNDFNGDRLPDLLVATPLGPRLFAGRKDKMEDVTGGLPSQPYPNVTAAAWLDADGDGRADILFADGFLGLRLYRNLTGDPLPAATNRAVGFGPWHYAGPFDNPGGNGFTVQYPPERGVDLTAAYVGKDGARVAWRPGAFRDGQINTLAVFQPPAHNENTVVYLYREIDFGGLAELPVSLGSDDTLTVWLNGELLWAENVARGCSPDEVKLTLPLRAGRNRLLMKICQGTGEFAFYFAAKPPTKVSPPLFEDATERAGLGFGGPAGSLKGDHLAVDDVNGDGRPDFLYSAGRGVLALNAGGRFEAARDAGIAFQAGGVAPAFGDFNGDKRPDLFVPQRQGASKLFVNDGTGRFRDASTTSIAFAQPIGEATCAAWTDFCGRGRLDLLVGCLRGPNRYFRNNGDGTFTDATASLGLDKRIYNTRGLCAVDLDRDNVPDLVLNNEGQDSAVLLGSPARMRLSLSAGVAGGAGETAKPGASAALRPAAAGRAKAGEG
jgi:hypothetical protein